jgi:hypothetical protein
MKDETTSNQEQPSDKPTKKKSRSKKNKIIDPKPIDSTTVSPQEDIENALKQKLANIISNKIAQYSDTIEFKKTTHREDFDCLRPIISEFLDDFLIIGHTIEGQRVVMRYTATPGDLDKLTELSRRVFIKMLSQDGQPDPKS